MSNVLLEREFEESRDGKTYRVKARAIFLIEGGQEKGNWHIDFVLHTGHPITYSPDHRLMSKEAAKRAAENEFDSPLGVKQHIALHLKSWINTGAIQPVPRNS
jgi:hypothetical protein